MFFLKKIFAFISVLFFVYCFAPSILAYADSNAFAAYDKCFTSRTDYSSPNEPPNNYDISGFNSSYTYCFCAGRTNNGIAIFTDSPVLIATSSDGKTCTLTPPSGYHYQAYSYNNSGLPLWHTTSQHSYTPSNFSGEWYGYVIYRNDCRIVDSDGYEVDSPLPSNNVDFNAYALTNKNIRCETSVSSENWYSCRYYIVPGGSDDLPVVDFFSDSAIISDSSTSAADRQSAIERIYTRYHIALDQILGDHKGLEIARAISSSGILEGAYTPDSLNGLVSSGFDTALTLVSTFDSVAKNSYPYYFVGDLAFTVSSPAVWEFNVEQFYSNCSMMSMYQDYNTIYCLVYDDTGLPCAVCSVGFKVSDFLPTIEFSMPDVDIIDSLPSLPSGGSDWTIYQHAQYMRYLAEMLARSWSINIDLNLPDYTFVTDVYPLNPYDMSLPDTSLPEMGGVPAELSKPFQAYGVFATDFLNSTGFMSILTWVCLASLAAWFIWGRRK